MNPVIGTKFFVVDSESKSTFQYDAAGNLITNTALAGANQTPWGAAASPDGSTLWAAEKERWIFVYDNNGALLGSWTPQGEPKFDGIATDGTDIWTVDAETDRVDRFAGAAARLSGTAAASYSFSLSGQNITPTGLTTDGTHLWVVGDSATVDRVFKYTVSGTLVGSWTIDATNANPTGITIDPTGASQNVWIVNSANATGKVFQYTAAATRTSGSQTADVVFALSAANANPQGIADPPPAGRRGIKALSINTMETREVASWSPDVEVEPTLVPGPRINSIHTNNRTNIVPRTVDEPHNNRPLSRTRSTPPLSALAVDKVMSQFQRRVVTDHDTSVPEEAIDSFSEDLQLLEHLFMQD